MGTIKVNGYAERKVEMDVASFTLTFSSSDLDAASCIESVQKEVETFLAKLKEMGFDLQKMHLDSDDIADMYDKRKLVGYTRTIMFDTDASAKTVNEIMNVIRQNQIKASVDIGYSYSKQQELHDELLREAVLDSKRKAQIIVGASGNKIVDIYSITYNSYGYPMLVEDRCAPDLANTPTMMADELGSREETENESIEIVWNFM